MTTSSQPVLLEWHHLSFGIQKRKSLFAKLKSWYHRLFKRPVQPGIKGDIQEDNNILEAISGRVLPGELVAILGGSGAGKTTLLNLLSGRLEVPGGHLTGTITLDGQTANSTWRPWIGYVEQEDRGFAYLTVYETLWIASQLRLTGSGYTDEVRRARVEQVLAMLGLGPVKTHNVKHISGGQRRRVSIGTELVSDAKILFLDEPTSGLDAFTASYTIDLLRSLVKTSGIPMLLTIHQPRFHILQMFDRLLLLSQGRTVFFGTLEETIEHFYRLGFVVPPNTNPADFFLGRHPICMRA